MNKHHFKNETNRHVASRVYQALEDAELKFQLSGKPRHETLRRFANRYHGAARRILSRVATLEAQGKPVCDHYYDDLIASELSNAEQQ